MIKLLSVSRRGFLSNRLPRTFPSLAVTAALATGLWIATAPVALARLMTPTEMIQDELPHGKTMKSATKPEFLSAVCAAVKRHRAQGPAIVRTAVLTHREYSGDIVATVLRCGTNADCSYVADVVRGAVAVAQDEAAAISDAAIAVAPDCADAIQAATQGDIPGEGPGGFNPGPVTVLPPPGGIGGGGGGVNPQQQLVLVCDNGTQRNVPEGQLSAFLHSHAGAFVGSCQATPTTNR